MRKIIIIAVLLALTGCNDELGNTFPETAQVIGRY
jgi:hypothetical protein